MYVIGVDPGKNSGYAVLNIESMEIEHMGIYEDNCEVLSQRVGFLKRDYRNPASRVPIVCEDFIPRFGQKFDLDSVYHIGALQAVHGKPYINLVAASTHKGLIPRNRVTELMRSQGFKVATGHSRDALSLCLYWAGYKAKDPNVLDWLSKES